ncbi:hypothetical protein ACN38_g8023, partial [Penicillium nordicum]
FRFSSDSVQIQFRFSSESIHNSDSIQIQFRFNSDSIHFRSPYTYIVSPILYVL